MIIYATGRFGQVGWGLYIRRSAYREFASVTLGEK